MPTEPESDSSGTPALDHGSPGELAGDGAFAWSVADSPRFLLHSHVLRGIGWGAIGVDRGQIGPSRACRADATEDGWAIVAENTTYGLSTASATAQGVLHGAATRAARDSFPESVLVHAASGEARASAAEAGATPTNGGRPGRETFDPTALALLDHLQLAQLLTRHHGIPYELRPELSRVVHRQWFDEILVLDAVVTYGVSAEVPPEGPVGTLGEPAAEPTNHGYPAPGDTLSITQRIALRPLPEPGFSPVRMHPRQGSIGDVELFRFDRIGEEDAREALAPVFRLTPGADNPPIVFRLDPGIPEPYRSAILNGANWWREVFEAIGQPDFYRVEVCPEGEDLFDPRYGTIAWTHRLDRGWAFGAIHTDPRTGEIIKGCVSLGSKRIEDVRTLAQAILGEADARRDEVEAIVLQRVEEVAAHEVGHTFGFQHNLASHCHSVPSVMDYLSPVFDVTDDGRVVSGDAQSPGQSYGNKLGPWDHWLVKALYAPQLLDSATAPGGVDDVLTYTSNEDSRHDYMADASGGRWHAPGRPLESFARIVRVRQVALARFSASSAPAGEDSNEIQRRFRLLYLIHRYQVVSVIKAVGGTVRKYAQAGETTPDGRFAGEWSPVPEEDQLEALRAVVDLLSPEFLEVPAHVDPLLVPPSGGVSEKPGGFENRFAGMVDIPSIVQSGADVILGPLLTPERLGRVVEQSTVVLHELLDQTVRKALRVLDDAAARVDGSNDVATLIAWAVIGRFKNSITSPLLHAHARFAILLHLEDVEVSSRLLQKKWDAVIDAALNLEDTPVVPPPGKFIL